MKLTRLMAVVFLLACGTSMFAQSTAQRANYLVSIARNVAWPATHTDKTFKIAVYGSFELYRELIGELMGRSVFNKNIEVYNLIRPSDLKLNEYHIIYVANEKCTPGIIKEISELSRAKSSLLITEKENSLSYGAVINFINPEGKLHFEASPDNAKLAGLKITTNLINLAYNFRRS